MLSVVAPIGLAAAAARPALVIDLDPHGPQFPGPRSLAELVAEGPTRSELFPRMAGARGSSVALLRNGGVGWESTVSMIEALAEQWPALVLRLPSRGPWPWPVVPVLSLLPGILRPVGGRAAVWQSVDLAPRHRARSRSRAACAEPTCACQDAHASVRAAWQVGEGLVPGLGAAVALTERLTGALIQSDVPLDREHLRSAVRRLAAAEAPLAGQVLFEQVIDGLVGLGPLETLLRDPAVSDVLVNSPDSVYVERGGELVRTDVSFPDDSAVVAAVERVIAPLGLRLDRASPTIDARLPDGSRLHAVIPPAAVDHPVVAIRRFVPSIASLDDLVGRGSISPSQGSVLNEMVVGRKNILVSGGTGTGKTTLLNVLAGAVPDGERTITIEDAAELRLPGHVIRLEGRPANSEGRGAISLRALLRSALRLRPDRIVIGEVRGAEALDLINALEHGTCRIDVDSSRQQSRRGPVAARDAGIVRRGTSRRDRCATPTPSCSACRGPTRATRTAPPCDLDRDGDTRWCRGSAVLTGLMLAAVCLGYLPRVEGIAIAVIYAQPLAGASGGGTGGGEKPEAGRSHISLRSWSRLFSVRWRPSSGQGDRSEWRWSIVPDSTPASGWTASFGWPRPGGRWSRSPTRWRACGECRGSPPHCGSRR